MFSVLHITQTLQVSILGVRSLSLLLTKRIVCPNKKIHSLISYAHSSELGVANTQTHSHDFRPPIRLIKNLLDGPSAFLMQSEHSGFCQMFYSLCLNINGMWWMLNVFADTFAQRPVDCVRVMHVRSLLHLIAARCLCTCLVVGPRQDQRRDGIDRM